MHSLNTTITSNSVVLLTAIHSRVKLKRVKRKNGQSLVVYQLKVQGKSLEPSSVSGLYTCGVIVWLRRVLKRTVMTDISTAWVQVTQNNKKLNFHLHAVLLLFFPNLQACINFAGLVVNVIWQTFPADELEIRIPALVMLIVSFSKHVKSCVTILLIKEFQAWEGCWPSGQCIWLWIQYLVQVQDLARVGHRVVLLVDQDTLNVPLSTYSRQV